MDLLAGYGQAPAKLPSVVEPAPVAPVEKKRKIAPALGALSAEQIHSELESRLAPERPQSECDPDMLRKITAAVKAGQSVVGRLKDHTGFKNPEIMGQLVKFVEIDEKGSNYPVEMFDPRCAAFKGRVLLAEEQNLFLSQLTKQAEQQQQEGRGTQQSPAIVVAKRETGDRGGSTSSSLAMRKSRKKSRFDVK